MLEFVVELMIEFFQTFPRLIISLVITGIATYVSLLLVPANLRFEVAIAIILVVSLIPSQWYVCKLRLDPRD